MSFPALSEIGDACEYLFGDSGYGGRYFSNKVQLRPRRNKDSREATGEVEVRIETGRDKYVLFAIMCGIDVITDIMLIDLVTGAQLSRTLPMPDALKELLQRIEAYISSDADEYSPDVVCTDGLQAEVDVLGISKEIGYYEDGTPAPLRPIVIARLWFDRGQDTLTRRQPVRC